MLRQNMKKNVFAINVEVIIINIFNTAKKDDVRANQYKICKVVD